MHEGIPILNYLVPKEFTHDGRPLTGVVFEKVAAHFDDKGRRRLEPTGEPDEHYRMRRRAGRDRPGERLPVDRARHRHRVRQVGHAGGRRRHHPVDHARASSSAATRPSARRTSSGRWRTATRRRSRSTSSGSRRRRQRPAAAARDAHQPEDGHPRVELRQRHLARPAQEGAAPRPEDRAHRHQGGGRARLRPRSSATRRRSAASTATCRRCSPTRSASSATPASTSARWTASPSPANGAGGRSARAGSTRRPST